MFHFYKSFSIVLLLCVCFSFNCTAENEGIIECMNSMTYAFGLHQPSFDCIKHAILYMVLSGDFRKEYNRHVETYYRYFYTYIDYDKINTVETYCRMFGPECKFALEIFERDMSKENVQYRFEDLTTDELAFLNEMFEPVSSNVGGAEGSSSANPPYVQEQAEGSSDVFQGGTSDDFQGGSTDVFQGGSTNVFQGGNTNVLQGSAEAVEVPYDPSEYVDIRKRILHNALFYHMIYDPPPPYFISDAALQFYHPTGSFGQMYLQHITVSIFAKGNVLINPWNFCRHQYPSQKYMFVRV